MKACLNSGVVVLLGLVLSGCSGWWGSKEKPKLPGKRISVMSLEQDLKPDPRLSDLAVRLPRPFRNTEWPQAGGYPNHSMQHLSASGNLTELWQEDIGDGSSDDKQLLAEPVVTANAVYTLDVDAEVRAFNPKTGSQLWESEVKPGEGEESDGTLGGGIAYADGMVFVTTGFGVVAALDARNGKEIWRRPVNAPVRAAPTIFKGRVFAVNIANETHALDAKTGKELWTHTGITETASLFGGASPAASGNIVISSYSSGEIVALRLENGRQIWTDSLSALRRTDPISTLAHIRGRPVIDRGIVFATANSGRTVAIDLRTGTRIWERDIGSSHGLWTAGQFVYLVSNGGQVACLARDNGAIKWIVQLPRFEDEEDREDPIVWTGPVLVSDRLLVGGSHGDVWSISPYTGKFLGRVEMSDPVFIAPVVADNIVYFLTNDARLTALK